MLTLSERAPAGKFDKPTRVVKGEQTRMPWAWSGLCFASPLHEPTALGYRDLCTMAAPSTLFNEQWIRDNRGNPAVGYDLTTHGFAEYTDHPSYRQPSTEITAYIRFKSRGIAATQPDGGYLVKVYATTSPWESWGILADSTETGKMYASLATGTTVNATGNTAVISTTEYLSAFLRWRSSEVMRLDVYNETGTLITSATSAGTVTGSIGYNVGQPLRIHCNEGNFVANAYISQALVWKRRLSEAETQAFVVDPFGWYAPRRETVVLSGFFPVVPAGEQEPEWTFGQAVQAGG